MTTTSDLHDTALPRFEDRLWDELSDLHRQRQDQRPTVVTPHKPGRRRRPLAIGAAVAVAAATTLVIGVATLPGGKPRPAAATVEERIVAATDAALANSVMHTSTDFVASSEGTDGESWVDVTSGSIRHRGTDDSGNLLDDRGPVTPPDPDDEAPEVESFGSSPFECAAPYEDEQGATLCDGDDVVWPDGYPMIATRVVWACPGGEGFHTVEDEAYLPFTVEAAHVRDEIEAGRLVADGTEVIDGRELIRLRDIAAEQLPDDFAVVQTVFVDPDTYLPVELRSDMGGPDQNVIRYEYFPRTEENLELLTPPIPEGYTQVDDVTACGGTPVDPPTAEPESGQATSGGEG